MKKILCAAFAVIIALSSLTFLLTSAVNNPIGVTDEMCCSDYWKERTVTDKDKVLLTKEQILQIQQDGIDDRATYMFDIENTATIKAKQQAANLNPVAPSGKTLYINGEKIDADALYKKINDAIDTTGYTEEVMEPVYAVTVRCTEMRSIPTEEVIGYSATDKDDELLQESLTVNEPFLVRAKCTYDDVTYYYGYSLNCPGWISGNDLAICSTKEEWIDAWKGEVGEKDFIVVTTDRITLDKTYYSENASDLKLRMGTVLKLVPEDEIPEIIGERGIWNNYIVYIPVRNDDGSYSKEIAMISEHNNVSVGYLDFTQSNVLDVAFECLGDTYGWAGWLDAYDCSLYMAMVYRCFGIIIPRNGTWQQNVVQYKYDLSDFSEEEKMKFLETMPAGTMLFMPGHVTMYLGQENGVGYVISALGTVVESEGETDVKSIYGTCVTPLTVRRGKSYSYCTWLKSLNAAICVVPKADISKCEIKACNKNGSDTEYILSVNYNGTELYEGINFTAEREGDILTLKGTNFFTGEVEIRLGESHVDDNNDDICDYCGNYVSDNFFTHLLFLIKSILNKILDFLGL